MDCHMNSNGGLLSGEGLPRHPKLKPGEVFFDDYKVYCTAVHFHFTVLQMAGASSRTCEINAETVDLFRFLLQHLEGFTWHNLDHETFSHLGVALANVFHPKYAQGQRLFSVDEKKRAAKFYRKLRDVRGATIAEESLSGQYSVPGHTLPGPQMNSTPVSFHQVDHLSSPAASHGAPLVASPANYHGGHAAASSNTGHELALEMSPANSPELALEASQSGSPELVSPASSPNAESSDSEPTSPTSPSSPTFFRPPPEHPIFGDNGPMRGIAFKLNNGKKSWVRNIFHEHLKKEAKCLGHNGIAVGSWWPAQSAACFNGAHASWCSGICGTAEDGAYSIVRSGKPDPEDKDNGDVLLYSGSKTGSKALLTSLETQVPVRVLRAAEKSDNVWSPSCGIRYDGLYRVHAVYGQVDDNDSDNSQLRFELHRLENQLELAKLTATPNSKEIKIHKEAKKGYPAVDPYGEN